MTCDRCRQTLTLTDWLHKWCPMPEVVASRSVDLRHMVTGLNAVLGERKLREALLEQEMQASYARTQP